jgi:hypothetical protein
MARPQVADGRGGLQIPRVAANMFNKQSRTADKQWSSSLGIFRVANTPQRTEYHDTQFYPNLVEIGGACRHERMGAVMRR